MGLLLSAGFPEAALLSRPVGVRGFVARSTSLLLRAQRQSQNTLIASAAHQLRISFLLSFSAGSRLIHAPVC